MTNKELVVKFLDYYNLRQVKGSPMTDKELLPLVPYLFADAGQTFYIKYFKDIETSHLMQKHRKRWQESYSEFMHTLFRPFGDNENDTIIDKMDDFEASLSNDLMITQVAYMNCVQDTVPFEQQKIVSAALMCNVLAQLAEVVWQDVYQRFPGNAYTNLHGIRVHAREFTRNYLAYIGSPNAPVPVDKQDKLEEAVEVLTNKIVKWLVNETGVECKKFKIKNR